MESCEQPHFGGMFFPSLDYGDLLFLDLVASIKRLCVDEKSVFVQQVAGSLLCPVIIPASHLLADINPILKWQFLI